MGKNWCVLIGQKWVIRVRVRVRVFLGLGSITSSHWILWYKKYTRLPLDPLRFEWNLAWICRCQGEDLWWNKKFKKFNRFLVTASEVDPLSTKFDTRLTFRPTLFRYNFFSMGDIILIFCMIVNSHLTHILYATDIWYPVKFWNYIWSKYQHLSNFEQVWQPITFLFF